MSKKQKSEINKLFVPEATESTCIVFVFVYVLYDSFDSHHYGYDYGYTTLTKSWICCPGWPQNKTERMWKEGQVPRPCSGIEKSMERESDNYTNCDWCFGIVTKGLLKGLEELEIRGRVETVKTTLLRTARILRRIPETWRDLPSLKLIREEWIYKHKRKKKFLT